MSGFITMILPSISSLAQIPPGAGGDLGGPTTLLATEAPFCPSPRRPSLRVVHDGLHVVPWKESRYSIHDAFVPPVVVLLYDVDDGPFLEGEFVLLVFSVVVDRHNWKQTQRD